MDANTTQIIGILVNAMTDLIAVVVAIWIGKRQIQIMLQPAPPAPAPKRKKRPKPTRIQRRLIRFFRYVQFLMVNSFLAHTYPDYLIWTTTPFKALRNVYAVIAILGYAGNVVVFFQLQWLIGRIKARDRAVLIRLGALKPRKPKQLTAGVQP